MTQDGLLEFLETHNGGYMITLGPFQFSERLMELRDGFSRLGLEIRRQEGVSLFFPGSYMPHEDLRTFVSKHSGVFYELLEVLHEITGSDAAIFSAIRHELTPIVLPIDLE